MKKFIVLCLAISGIIGATNGFGAANVLMPKKADSVAKREASTSMNDVGASIAPTAVNLVTGLIALNQQQKVLVAECEPTARDIDFVNKMIKEWAIAGGVNPLKSGGINKNGINGCTNGLTYESSVGRLGANMSVGTTSLCYDVFTDADARGAVWAGFPKASKGTYCSDGTLYSVCPNSKKKTMTNMWVLFDMINFDDKDYTRAEASQAQALRQKAANCSGNKLAAKRLESVGSFVKSSIANAGQTTNTGSIMDAVSGLVNQSGLSGVGGLANVATQFLDK